jgi:hypothetical protein
MNYLKDLIDYCSRLLQWWVVIMPWDRGLRVRIGNRVKYLNPGVHVKIPLLDRVFVQGIRLRIVEVPIQTLSTQDRHVVTVTATVGFYITDLEKLYQTIFQPNSTIANIVRAHIAEFISTKDLSECKPGSIEDYVMSNMPNDEYGLSYEYIKIVGFAVVRTFRIISDKQIVPYDNSQLDQHHP